MTEGPDSDGVLIHGIPLRELFALYCRCTMVPGARGVDLLSLVDAHRETAEQSGPIGCIDQYVLTKDAVVGRTVLTVFGEPVWCVQYTGAFVWPDRRHEVFLLMLQSTAASRGMPWRGWNGDSCRWDDLIHRTVPLGEHWTFTQFAGSEYIETDDRKVLYRGTVHAALLASTTEP